MALRKTFKAMLGSKPKMKAGGRSGGWTSSDDDDGAGTESKEESKGESKDEPTELVSGIGSMQMGAKSGSGSYTTPPSSPDTAQRDLPAAEAK